MAYQLKKISFQPSSEFALLLEITNPTPLKESCHPELSREHIDFTKFLKIASYHKLLPLLAKRYQVFPEEFQQEVKQAARTTSLRNLMMTGCLVSVLELFKENNISALPFKGPALSQKLYGDINCRTFCDLDIIVSSEDAIKARDVLLENNFKVLQEIQDKNIPSYLSAETYFNFSHSDNHVPVDLQWDLTNKYSIRPIVLEDIFPFAEKLKLAGRDITYLSDEDSYIHLCIHGSSHCWSKLESITAVSHLLHNNKSLNWDRIIQQSVSIKSFRMILLGTYLCHKIYNTNVPQPVTDLINDDSRIQKLGDKIICHLSQEDLPENDVPSHHWRFSWMHLQTRDSFFDTLHYLARLIFRPTVKELLECKLIGRISFLNSTIRPIRLLSEMFKHLYSVIIYRIKN